MDNNLLDQLLQKYNIEKSKFNALIGKGWIPLLEECFLNLQAISFPCKIHQIKPKFGELRIYFDIPLTTKAEEIIDKACSLSRETCIVCSSEGKIVSIDGWFSCFCSACEEKVRKIKKNPQCLELILELYKNGK